MVEKASVKTRSWNGCPQQVSTKSLTNQLHASRTIRTWWYFLLWRTWDFEQNQKCLLHCFLFLWSYQSFLICSCTKQFEQEGSQGISDPHKSFTVQKVIMFMASDLIKFQQQLNDCFSYHLWLSSLPFAFVPSFLYDTQPVLCYWRDWVWGKIKYKSCMLALMLDSLP